MKIGAYTIVVSVIAFCVVSLASRALDAGLLVSTAHAQTVDGNSDDVIINNATTSLNILKVAVTDHYAKFGSLPVGDNAFELLLRKEGLLNEPLSLMSRNGNPRTESHVRVIKALSPTVLVTATNAAYNFQGGPTNQTAGSFVVETVIRNVASRDARELSLRIDGPELSSPLGAADLKGRVKFGAIPTNGFGEVHVYIIHRGL